MGKYVPCSICQGESARSHNKNICPKCFNNMMNATKDEIEQTCRKLKDADMVRLIRKHFPGKKE